MDAVSVEVIKSVPDVRNIPDVSIATKVKYAEVIRSGAVYIKVWQLLEM